MTMDPGKCVRCERADAVKGGECNTCGHVSTVLTFIHLRWRREELENLAKKLREDSLDDFLTKCSASGHRDSRSLGLMIQRLAYPARMTPDAMKQKVCSALGHYLAEMEGLDKWEAKPGNKGAWMRGWIDTVKGWTERKTNG